MIRSMTHTNYMLDRYYDDYSNGGFMFNEFVKITPRIGGPYMYVKVHQWEVPINVNGMDLHHGCTLLLTFKKS